MSLARFVPQKASRYLGANAFARALMNLLGRNQWIPYALGLERDHEILLKPYCPPYYASMKDAVRAVVETKYGPHGLFRGGAEHSAWLEPAAITNAIAKISSAAVEATTAYCEYIYNRCGRFPAYMPPFRTVLGFQACHLDNEFYDRFYRAGPGRFPKRNAVTWTGGTSRTRMGPNKSISASSPKQACARAGVACFRQPFGLTMQGKKNSRRP